MSRRWSILTASALFVCSVATSALVPLLDPDEGYYPATAAESLRSQPAWDLTFNGEPRWEKPFLSYGLIQASFLAFGQSAITARLPSAVEGACLILFVGAIVAALAGARAGGLASVVVSSTLALQIFSRAAHPEIAVVLSIVTTDLLICLWLGDSRHRRGRWIPWIAGCCVGYGVLAKGPVAVVLPTLMTVAALAWRRRLPLLGESVRAVGAAACTAAIVALPWFVAMAWRHGPAFLNEALWSQNVTRYTSGAYGHQASWTFFIVPTLVGLLPWTGFLPRALVNLRAGEASTERQWLRVCMASAALTAFAFYTLSGSKLANYTLVIIPPLAILVALSFDDRVDLARRASIWDRALPAAVLLILGVAVLLLPLAVGRLISIRELLGGVPARGLDVVGAVRLAVLAPGLALLAAGAAALSRRPRVQASALACAGFVVPLMLLVGARPLLHADYPWEQFGARIRAEAGPVWLVGYRAPSLTFYASRPVTLVTDVGELRDVLRARVAGWIVLEQDVYNDSLATAALHDTGIEIVATGGRMVLLRVRPTHAG